MLIVIVPVGISNFALVRYFVNGFIGIQKRNF